ncbi:MAG TPA: DUF3379 family protein, partial [Woeseiaceae bacterium]|nr:DUF3379 family protein [Woeseiaceae bacterium]
ERYREAIAADPSERFDGGRAHAETCPACRAFRAEMRSLDERIARALAIEAPESRLPELPASAASVPRSRRKGAARRRTFAASIWVGLAAGIGVAAVVAWHGLGSDEVHSPLARQVLAHMDHEQSSRRVTAVAVSDAAVDEVLAPRVSAFDAGAGVISYVMPCVINGKVTPHLVVQGRTGPITLILLPEETLDAPIPLSGEHVHGVILPAGSGSVAVIGQREEQSPEIEAIGARVIDSVKWTI